jgi:hypothetical protein
MRKKLKRILSFFVVMRMMWKKLCVTRDRDAVVGYVHDCQRDSLEVGSVAVEKRSSVENFLDSEKKHE